MIGSKLFVGLAVLVVVQHATAWVYFWDEGPNSDYGGGDMRRQGSTKDIKHLPMKKQTHKRQMGSQDHYPDYDHHSDHDSHCTPGTLFNAADHCNHCICPASGYKNDPHKYCTVQPCQYGKKRQHPHRRQAHKRGSCKPGETYMQDCNMCVCDKRGQGACTKKVCVPKGLDDAPKPRQHDYDN